MDKRTKPKPTQPGEPRLADYGGQYRPAIGESTRDKTDRETDLEALRGFEAERREIAGQPEVSPW